MGLKSKMIYFFSILSTLISYHILTSLFIFYGDHFKHPNLFALNLSIYFICLFIFNMFGQL